MQDPESKVISCRWVICNKNDADDPDVRARLVAQEVGTHSDMSLFAATPPPLESKRMLLSQWASERRRDGALPKLSFIDVKNAYLLWKTIATTLYQAAS